MAIHPVLAPEGDAAPIDVEAWTEQATQALGNITITPAPAVAVARASVTLEIPLDGHDAPQPVRTVGLDASASVAEPARSSYVRRREPIRRDSLKRREALLKGNEGSRRRQRWENDHLINNPHAQPPLPSDWEVRPTYPVFHVPYYLAPLWDAGAAARAADKKKKGSKGSKGTDEQDMVGKVPRELREKLKRSRAAKGLLQDLEEEVRKFVEKWEEKEKRLEEDGMVDLDSEDEEIVFVGRNRQPGDVTSLRPTPEELKREKLLFDSPADDQSANFGRWLVHHLGSYYGLQTWSVTVGNPARREAYIGFKDKQIKAGRNVIRKNPLPRPLWGLV